MSKIESFVPKSQWLNSIKLTMNRFSIDLSHVRVGEATFLHRDDADTSNWQINQNTGRAESRDQVFSAKHLLNSQITYKISLGVTFTLGAHNLTDQYPDKLQHSENVPFGVNTYSPNVRHFDLRGRYFYGLLKVKL